jgi:hypothetical protein
MTITWYMPDTNMLVHWAHALHGEKTSWGYDLQKIQAFMEHPEHRFILTDLVLAEFVGVFLQKITAEEFQGASAGIRMSNGSLIRRAINQRQTFVQQIQARLRKPDYYRYITCRDLEESPFDRAARVYYQFLGQQRVLDVVEIQLREAQQKPGGQVKLLDGMDAPLISYLAQIASRYRDEQVEFVSCDTIMYKIWNYRMLDQFGLPKNAGVMDPKRFRCG